jgi:hypothetical protein
MNRFIRTTKQRKQIRQITMNCNVREEEEKGGNSNDGEMERGGDNCSQICVSPTAWTVLRKIAHFMSLRNHHFQSWFFSALEII